MQESNIEQAYKLINELKAITAEIMEIDSFVQKAAESKEPIKISIEAFMPEEEYEGKNQRSGFFNDHEKEVARMMGWPTGGWPTVILDCRKQNNSPRSYSILKTVSDTAMFSILGVILSERKAEQNAIIERLKNLGVVV